MHSFWKRGRETLGRITVTVRLQTNVHRCGVADLLLCSETLFRTLEAIRRLKLSTRSGRLLPAIFVHLPDYEALPQADMVQLIRALGLQMAAMQ